MTAMTHVYRWRGPHYGRLCTVIALAKVQHDGSGKVIHNTGHEAVGLEFEDGTRALAERQQVIRLGSKPANQVIAKAARGVATHLGRWKAQQARKDTL